MCRLPARPFAFLLRANWSARSAHLYGMALIIDPQVAGISGDMLLCALIDIGANKKRVVHGIETGANLLDGSSATDIEFTKVTKHGVAATALRMKVHGTGHAGSELKACISRASEELGLLPETRAFAQRSLEKLIDAEAHIHGQDPASVHLHEAGSADTIVDILGTAVAMEDLGTYGDEVFCCPVALGGGTVSFSHGTMSNPTAAVLEILRGTGITVTGGPELAEMTTPTGACMLASLRPVATDYYPPMQVDRIGYGSGTRDFKRFANVLKVVAGKGSSEYGQDTVHVLETNVDDISGELLASAVERLVSAGARDVTVVPGLTKKGRITNIVTVICDADTVDTLLNLLMEETGTLGVRVRTSRRVVRTRQTGTASVSLGGRSFRIRYQTHGRSGRFKVEHEDVRRISSEAEIPLTTAEELIKAQLRKILDEA